MCSRLGSGWNKITCRGQTKWKENRGSISQSVSVFIVTWFCRKPLRNEGCLSVCLEHGTSILTVLHYTEYSTFLQGILWNLKAETPWWALESTLQARVSGAAGRSAGKGKSNCTRHALRSCTESPMLCRQKQPVSSWLSPHTPEKKGCLRQVFQSRDYHKQNMELCVPLAQLPLAFGDLRTIRELDSSGFFSLLCLNIYLLGCSMSNLLPISSLSLKSRWHDYSSCICSAWTICKNRGTLYHCHTNGECVHGSKGIFWALTCHLWSSDYIWRQARELFHRALSQLLMGSGHITEKTVVLHQYLLLCEVLNFSSFAFVVLLRLWIPGVCNTVDVKTVCCYSGTDLGVSGTSNRRLLLSTEGRGCT